MTEMTERGLRKRAAGMMAFVPSVIPDIFSRESIFFLSFLLVRTREKKDGFPITNVGNDGKRGRE